MSNNKIHPNPSPNNSSKLVNPKHNLNKPQIKHFICNFNIQMFSKFIRNHHKSIIKHFLPKIKNQPKIIITNVNQQKKRLS